MRYECGTSGARWRTLRFEQCEPRTMLSANSFLPYQDAYLEDGTRFDTTQLRVDAASPNRTSYIEFNLSSLADQPIQNAVLRLRVSDAGSGTINVHQGTANLWTELFLTPVSAPTPVALLDSKSGSFSSGTWLEFNVTAGVHSNGYTNFIVTIASSSDGVAFSSGEGTESPQLIVNTGLGGDADSNNIVDAADFVVWRNTLGSQTDLRADFNNSGTVDSADYQIWRSNFGKVLLPSAPLGSVTLYGATPNDSTYDTAAIQAAINANTSVYFPPGEYWLDSKLTVPAGRTLYGPSTGPPAVLRVRFDTGVNANNYALEIIGNDVTLQDLVIDKDFVDGSYGVGIIANNRSNITISGVEIRDYSVRYGIHLIECTNFRIANCYVHDFMMNQYNPTGNEADMIQDSPAGIRITRSTNGIITNSRVYNIEVGPNGRASTSELVPSYGPQGYQSDCITLSDSSGIIVEDNDLWSSGEIVDTVASDSCIVRNNRIQMGWFLGIKGIGTQNSIFKDNYIGDCAIGVILIDHTSTGEECSGNLVDGNDIVNCGSAGIWNLAAAARMPFAISGIYIDDNASGNTVTNNRIYNYFNYLPQMIRQGSAANMIANNATTTTEYGPGGGGDVRILGDWVAGLTHAKELIAPNRLLVFFTYAEDNSANIAATSVIYGGKAMTRVTEQLTIEGTRRVYVSTWILRQDLINSATTSNFLVTWNSTPDSVGYSSVFLTNVYQKTPQYTWTSAGATTGDTLTADPRVTHAGDIAVYAAVAAEPGEFTPLNGYTEALEIEIPNADGTVGYIFASGSEETASATHTSLGTGALQSIVFQKNPAAVSTGTTVDVTTLGAFVNDGVNDAVILQNALNNPAYTEVYLPPGVYDFDRSVFIPSNKSVRGANNGVTQIRTMADITPFRFDHVTGAAVSNLSITRPQTQDSNNEIIRSDYSSFITVDSIRVDSSASRAPIINMQYGNRNRVTRCSIFDYQVLRSEPSPETSGNQLQVFGSGITFTAESNITITDCTILQNTPMTVENPIVKGWYQSSAIQVPVCDTGTVARNYIYRTGQGIDTSGAKELRIADNFVEQIHSAGIKLVNGSNHILVENNYLRNCGLTGIWVSVGVKGNGGSFENTVRNNIMVGIGKGIGLDFWDFNFGASPPAAIHLQAAKLDTDRVRNNLIRSNRTYDNTEQRGVVVAEPTSTSDPYGPINNTIVDNLAVSGLAPEPVIVKDLE